MSTDKALIPCFLVCSWPGHPLLSHRFLLPGGLGQEASTEIFEKLLKCPEAEQQDFADIHSTLHDAVLPLPTRRSLRLKTLRILIALGCSNFLRCSSPQKTRLAPHDSKVPARVKTTNKPVIYTYASIHVSIHTSTTAV